MNDTLNQLPKITKALKKISPKSGFSLGVQVSPNSLPLPLVDMTLGWPPIMNSFEKFKWNFMSMRNWTTGLIADPALGSKAGQLIGPIYQMVLCQVHHQTSLFSIMRWISKSWHLQLYSHCCSLVDKEK